MDRSLDIAEAVLYIIFGTTILFLVYFLIDIKSVFAKSRRQRYMLGHPEYKDLESSEGVIEVKKDKAVFKEIPTGKEYFSIPLEEITDVSTGYGAVNASNNMLRSISRLVDERHYLFIEVQKNERRHTLKFSSHRASPVNDEVRERILREKQG